LSYLKINHVEVRYFKNIIKKIFVNSPSQIIKKIQWKIIQTLGVSALLLAAC
jgi:hypothetical protein